MHKINSMRDEITKIKCRATNLNECSRTGKKQLESQSIWSNLKSKQVKRSEYGWRFSIKCVELIASVKIQPRGFRIRESHF